MLLCFEQFDNLMKNITIYIILAIISYLLYKHNALKWTTGKKNFCLFCLNCCCFNLLLPILSFTPKYSFNSVMSKIGEYEEWKTSYSKVWSYMWADKIDYNHIFLGSLVTILLIAIIDFKLLTKYSYFNNSKSDKIFYNLDTSKAVIDKIVAVTVLIAAFIIILYKLQSKHDIPYNPNFAGNFQYIFSLYLVPLQCTIDYLIAKNKNDKA